MKLKLVLSTAIFLASSLSMAATFRETKSLKRLNHVQSGMDDACGALDLTNSNCNTFAYRILSRPQGETWVNTVKQIIFSSQSPFVEEVEALLIPNRGEFIRDAMYDVLSAAGFDLDVSEAAEAEVSTLDDTLGEDVAMESGFVGVRGTIQGAHSLKHEFLAIIDLRNSQVLLFQGGSSE